MKKNNRRPSPTMPRHESSEPHEPPSPQALIERTRAEAAAAKNPLAFAMGEPLPGRSALDKMRARAQATLDAAAGAGDNVIALDNREPRGRRFDKVSPGVFRDSSRTQARRYD